MELKVMEYILKNKMIGAGDSVLVGVSGGADSLALLHFLYTHAHALGCTLGVAHLNHDMRGETADADQAFVADFCARRKIPFYAKRMDVVALSKAQGVGVEVGGREARYHFFKEVMDREGYGLLATAHHGNDQAETLIMRLLRGTGIEGAAGIPPVEGVKIRPLLCVSRGEIVAYCQSHDLAYRHDATNDDLHMTRNYLRHRIMPELVGINPSAVTHLSEFCAAAAAYQDFLDHYLDANQDRILGVSATEAALRLEPWLKEEALAQSAFLRRAILQGCGSLVDVEQKHIQGLLALMTENPGNWEYHLPHGGVVRRRYDRVLFNRGDVLPPFMGVYPVIPGKRQYLAATGFYVETQLILSKDLNVLHKMKNFGEIIIDYGRIKNNLVLRGRQPGDFIYLKGMVGRKKIKDLFIDRKIPKEKRSGIPLLACGQEVLWIPGYAVSRQLEVLPDTNKLLWMKLERLKIE